MQSPIVQIEHLSYSFGKQHVLDNISLNIPSQSIYGFLGPNGAGKTTTLRLLLGLLKNKGTTIKIFGLNFQQNRIAILKKIGSLIEQPSLYLHLTGRENLETFRLAYQCNKKRINEVLDIVDLADAADKKAKAYSFGMKQRLAIAIALLHDPDLMIFDEPTNGLDPYGIIETRELIKKLNRDLGKTILISSHLLTEIEKIATHVAIIHKGKILFRGTLSQLQQMRPVQSTIAVQVDEPQKAKLLLENNFAIKNISDLTLHIDIMNKAQAAELNALLVHNNIKVYSLSIADNDLENLFIQITSS